MVVQVFQLYYKWYSNNFKTAGTSFTTFLYTATSGQTTFSGADDNTNTLAYTTGSFDVFLNGVLLDESDFTAQTAQVLFLQVVFCQ